MSTTSLVMFAAAALVVLTLLLVLLWTLRPRKKAPSKQAYSADLTRRRMALDEMGYSVLHNVRIHDGNDKVLRIDHVVRLPASVLVVTTGPLDAIGPVKANPGAPVWRYAAAGNKIGTFTNPVLQIQPLIQALRSRFPLVRVRIITVFPDSAELGRNPPRGCCTSSDFVKTVEDFAREDGVESQAVEAAWDPLTRALMMASQQSSAANKSGSNPGTRSKRAVS